MKPYRIDADLEKSKCICGYPKFICGYPYETARYAEYAVPMLKHSIEYIIHFADWENICAYALI